MNSLISASFYFFILLFLLTFLNSRNGIVHFFLIKKSITNDMYMKTNVDETLSFTWSVYCIARIHYSLTNKNSWLSNFLNWFSSNLHTDTSVLLFIPACCKLLMFRSWFRKHALAFPTSLSPAILTVFLSHPASFISRFDLFYWHESCWLLRKTHDCWCYSQKTLPIRIQENCKYRGKPNVSEALCGYKNITSPIVYSTRVVYREFIIRHHTRFW